MGHAARARLLSPSPPGSYTIRAIMSFPWHMTDEPTAGRRANMAAIRRRDTAPEMSLRSKLHRRGRRFRVDLRINTPAGPVRPDLVFTKRRIAIFVDSCFFHSCPRHGVRTHIRNATYWVPKLESVRLRDLRDTSRLTASGWTVIRVWSHEDMAAAADAIDDMLLGARGIHDPTLLRSELRVFSEPSPIASGLVPRR